jgi:hypothetical protein
VLRLLDPLTCICLYLYGRGLKLARSFGRCAVTLPIAYCLQPEEKEIRDSRWPWSDRRHHIRIPAWSAGRPTADTWAWVVRATVHCPLWRPSGRSVVAVSRPTPPVDLIRRRRAHQAGGGKRLLLPTHATNQVGLGERTEPKFSTRSLRIWVASCDGNRWQRARTYRRTVVGRDEHEYVRECVILCRGYQISVSCHAPICAQSAHAPASIVRTCKSVSYARRERTLALRYMHGC